MLSISRFCRNSSILPHIKKIVVGSKNIAQNVSIRPYGTPALNRQTLYNALKVS